MSKLFSPLALGAITVPNRIFMAPLTRCRADAEHVPTALMAQYYAQRASGGLVVAEATMAMAGNSAFWREPGIHSPEPVSYTHLDVYKRQTPSTCSDPAC